MSKTPEFRHGPLEKIHIAMSAKMIPFGGFLMPVQYSGILVEHKTTREAVTLTDVSHMGRIGVYGKDALEFVNEIVTSDITKLIPGQARYTLMCNEDGGIVDDLLVYRHESPEQVGLVINAGNRDKDLAWMGSHKKGFRVSIVDNSNLTQLLALQGPKSQEVLSKMTDIPLDNLRYYHFTQGIVDKRHALVSRTGYTGEDGFELWMPAYEYVWGDILEAGKDSGLLPAGLGARNTLRLEMGYPLYGHEIDEEINPFEAGLGRVIFLEKPRFIGREALTAIKEAGINRRLVGLQADGSGFTPKGKGEGNWAIVHGDNQVGWVAAGSIAPSLNARISTGFVHLDLAEPGTTLTLVDPTGKKVVEAKVVEMPFYKGGSIRRSAA